MTGVQAGTLSVLLAGAGAVTVLVLAGGAVLARLWFLARIEAIRDDTVTAILDGKLRQEAAVTALLATLDDLAQPARRPRITVRAAAWHGQPASQNPAPLCPGYNQLTPAERDIITGLAARTHAATRCYLAFGQPPGSFALLTRSWP